MQENVKIEIEKLQGEIKSMKEDMKQEKEKKEEGVLKKIREEIEKSEIRKMKTLKWSRREKMMI